MQLLCRHKCRHRVIKCGMNHCKVCSVSVSNCSQRRQLRRHTQDSSLCTAQLRVKTERTQNSSYPLLFRPFPGLLPAELSKRMAEIDTLINAHHVQRAVDLSRRLIALCKEGMRYYHTYHRLPLKVAMTAGFVGWLACVLVAIPSKKFLDKIPAQTCPRSCQTCQDYAGQDLTQDMARSQPPAKILASCQDLALLGKNLWYQSSPIQYYWYYALPLVCLSYVWLRRSAFRAAWQGMATKRVLLLMGTVHLVGVVVDLEAPCHELLLSGGALCCPCGCLHLAVSLWDARIIMASSDSPELVLDILISA